MEGEILGAKIPYVEGTLRKGDRSVLVEEKTYPHICRRDQASPILPKTGGQGSLIPNKTDQKFRNSPQKESKQYIPRYVDKEVTARSTNSPLSISLKRVKKYSLGNANLMGLSVGRLNAMRSKKR